MTDAGMLSYQFRHRKFEAIVIGGSWGGMDALLKITKNLPANFPVPVIAVLHRQKDLDSDLVSILGKYSKLKIKEIQDKEFPVPGCLYLAPQNYHILVEKEKSLSLCASEAVFYSRPSIDVLFESAAYAYHENLLAILLTGANEDGTQGMKTISEAGGFTIIQDPEDAESAYMPVNALKVIQPDFIFTRHEISEFLLKLI